MPETYMWAVWGWLRPHKAESAWSPERRRYVCSVCMRRIRFRGGTEPFHKWWWRCWD